MFAKKPESKYGCFLNIFGVLRSRSSRWRKASKCKLHIQNLLCSVKLHRNRRECIVRQSRSDIAQLLSYGRYSEALPKAKQFYEDERRLSAYDQVELFCTTILQNISSLKYENNVDLLPEETKKAMAGIIFAASRIGELEDLQHIRSFFVQRFGLKFDKECVDLRQGNVVGFEIVKILNTNMRGDEITHIVRELSHKYKTNITTSTDSISEDLASSDDLGIADSDAMKVEKMKRALRRKKVMKENSKFLHPNLRESQGRDRSFRR
ncbi:unnamed protein product [Arabidopsis thaliana]|uniref:(thale cress) hypothetical protein n=1 Tax=Arabidopsis thaliana TaxID=3702 RepID=A0A7G2EIR9_ARATH|nr:unnamed protein product [Arabidopsis thaliana]